MEAKIVVGLGFGDEGKGITTDFLASKVHVPTLNVRFNGGQQAGHTVVMDEQRHTYATFGSGTGRGLPTYLSEYCTFYPPNALTEYDVLRDKGFKPSLYVHPLAKLTTHWDVAWGRMWERIYGHGSCGIGIGATMSRTEKSPYKLCVVDLKYEDLLRQKLNKIHSYYRGKLKELDAQEKASNWRTYFYDQVNIEEIRFNESIKSEFISELTSYRIVAYDRLRTFRNFIFEGAQGIMLDMEHGLFPNVTYSYTTSRNALAICEQLGIPQMGNIDLYYVTRCYSTRHGAGWAPDKGSIILTNNQDEHNCHNEWQKDFKTGELDYNLLSYAMDVDNAYSWGYSKNLVVTCLDQREGFKFDYSQTGVINFDSIYESWSPNSKDFKKVL